MLQPGQQHESTVFEHVMDKGAGKRCGPGRPRRRPHRLAGDKADSNRRIRCWLRRRGIRVTIPRKQNER